jgi:hypothetical protein
LIWEIESESNLEAVEDWLQSCSTAGLLWRKRQPARDEVSLKEEERQRKHN